MKIAFVNKNEKLVILSQTSQGLYNSIPTRKEVETFNSMTDFEKNEYLQDTYYNNGHGEGASNLKALAEAASRYYWYHIVVVVEEC